MRSGELIPTLPKLPSLPVIGRGGGSASFDEDAQAYFDRVAATASVADTEEVNDLFVGLKDISLYSGLTDGILGRSGLNAGTGTTAYAMKSGSNNGTLTNGPTWSADGFRLTVKNHAIATSITATLNHAWTICVVYKDAVGDNGTNRRVMGASTVGAPTIMFMEAANKALTHINVYDGGSVYQPGGTINATNWGMRILTNDIPGGIIRGYDNTTDLFGYASVGIAAGSHSLQIGTSSGEGTVNPDMTVAAMFYWNNTTFSAGNVSDLYDLLSSTIAPDLLP